MYGQLYFLVLPQTNFGGFIKGKGALYTNFWNSRQEELGQLPQSDVQAITGYLNQQIFGVSMDDEEEKELERQKVFNEANRRELEARSTKEKAGDGSQEKR